MKVSAKQIQSMGFIRIAENLLVHKAKKDIWKLKQDGKDDYTIERLDDKDLIKEAVSR